VRQPALTLAIVTRNQPAALKLAVQSALANAGALKGQVAVRVTINGAEPTVAKDLCKYLGRLKDTPIDVDFVSIDAKDVYAAYNNLVTVSPTDFVLLANDDMVFGPDWAVPLMSEAAPNIWVSPVLVEPGVVPVAKVNVLQDFGRDVESFQSKEWGAFVTKHRGSEVAPSGWFMPVLVHRETFLSMGGYPLDAPFPHPNDLKLFTQIMPSFGVKHVRHYGSWAYHFQRLSQREGKGTSPPEIVEPRASEGLTSCRKPQTEEIGQELGKNKAEEEGK